MFEHPLLLCGINQPKIIDAGIFWTGLSSDEIEIRKDNRGKQRETGNDDSKC